MNKLEFELKWCNASHAAGICAIYQPIVKNTAISFELEIPSAKNIGKRISETTQANPWLIATHKGQIIGYAYSTLFRSREAYQFTRELAVYVHPDFSRKGVARSLYEKLMELLVHMGCQQLMAVITLPNDASVKFHQNIGFKEAGIVKRAGFKFSKFWDIGIYQKEVNSEILSPSLKPIEQVKSYFLASIY